MFFGGAGRTLAGPVITETATPTQHRIHNLRVIVMTKQPLPNLT
jgi:hypothetical protein